MQRKDKKKVVDDVWTEDHVRSFLSLEAPAGMNADFHRLQRAYQSMRVEDFEDFIAMFRAAGGALDARGPEGQTIAEEIARHRHGAPFLDALHATSL